MKKKIFSVGLCFLIIGCTTALTPEGQKVRPISESQKIDCKFLDTVTAYNDVGATSGDDARNAINEMRNKVAAMGADSYYLVSSDTTWIGSTATAEAYSCGETIEKISQGVEITGKTFKSTACYRYTEDEGRINAKKKVKNLAYSEAIEAIKTKIESKTTIETKQADGVTRQSMTSEINSISLNVYKNSDVNYIVDIKGKVCAEVTGEIEDM